MRTHFLWALALLGLPAIAAERKLDFGEVREGQMPPGFRSAVTGDGKPGDWQVILDETPSLFPPLTPGAPSVARRAALAQMAQDRTDEHFPRLILDHAIFADLAL